MKKAFFSCQRIASASIVHAIALCLVIRLDAAAPVLTVSAAASLKDALNEIKTLYTAGHADAEISYNFGGSGALQQQIENGAPVDVFVSAAAKQMDVLENKGMLAANTRRDLLTNTLVLIVPKDSVKVKSMADLVKPEVDYIAIGDPKSVPVGSYAKEIFTYLKMWNAVEPKLVRMLDVRQVLTTVETSNASAGIVYLTDAKLSNKVRVAATASEDSHSPVIYPVAVINGTKYPEAAQAFASFLAGETARRVFVKFGFGILPER